MVHQGQHFRVGQKVINIVIILFYLIIIIIIVWLPSHLLSNFPILFKIIISLSPPLQHHQFHSPPPPHSPPPSLLPTPRFPFYTTLINNRSNLQQTMYSGKRQLLEPNGSCLQLTGKVSAKHTSLAGCGCDCKYQQSVNNVDIDNNSNTTSASYNISFSC